METIGRGQLKRTAGSTMNQAPDSFDEIVQRAEHFEATLTGQQRHALLLEYAFKNAANWSNLPQSVLRGRGRSGLCTGTLTTAQWSALIDLLNVAAGDRRNGGFDEVHAYLEADDYLREHSGKRMYGRDTFYVALLGRPSRDGTWELQFGGHHLAVANTYVDGTLASVTPSFRGIEPFPSFMFHAAIYQPLLQRHQALTALLAALSEDQLKKARLSGTHEDVLLGPGRDWMFLTGHEGVIAAGFDAPQRALLLAAIESYVNIAGDGFVRNIIAEYTRELDSTYVGFSGSPTLISPRDYLRIDGPSVWIECSMHTGGVFPHPHPHTVWRDKRRDYGGTTD